MNTELVITWLFALVPLAISPGPANVLFAASGSSFGIRGTIPFWLGTNIICLFQSLAVGLGLGFLLSNYPQTVELIKYVGVIFLLYLAFKLFRMSIVTREAIKPLRFVDGVIVEILNIKYLMIPTVMFSQFYTPEKENYSQVLMLTMALALLTMASNFVWIMGGKTLTTFAINKNIQKTQGIVFGVLLCVTAIWLAIG